MKNISKLKENILELSRNEIILQGYLCHQSLALFHQTHVAL